MWCCRNIHRSPSHHPSFALLSCICSSGNRLSTGVSAALSDASRLLIASARVSRMRCGYRVLQTCLRSPSFLSYFHQFSLLSGSSLEVFDKSSIPFLLRSGSRRPLPTGITGISIYEPQSELVVSEAKKPFSIQSGGRQAGNMWRSWEAGRIRAEKNLERKLLPAEDNNSKELFRPLGIRQLASE